MLYKIYTLPRNSHRCHQLRCRYGWSSRIYRIILYRMLVIIKVALRAFYLLWVRKQATASCTHVEESSYFHSKIVSFRAFWQNARPTASRAKWESVKNVNRERIAQSNECAWICCNWFWCIFDDGIKITIKWHLYMHAPCQSMHFECNYVDSKYPNRMKMQFDSL